MKNEVLKITTAEEFYCLVNRPENALCCVEFDDEIQRSLVIMAIGVQEADGEEINVFELAKADPKREMDNAYACNLGTIMSNRLAGSPVFLHLEGDIYFYGLIGLKKNQAEAFGYYLDAAKQKYIPAANMVADCYAFGVLGEINEKEAEKYYKIGAKCGERHAMYGLGRIYWQKKSNKKDREAVELFFKSAIQGYPDGVAALGWCYETGRGGAVRDYDRAFECYECAAKVDCLNGLEGLARCYKKGLGCEKDVEKSVEYEAKAKAIKKLGTAAWQKRARICSAKFNANVWTEVAKKDAKKSTKTTSKKDKNITKKSSETVVKNLDKKEQNAEKSVKNTQKTAKNSEKTIKNEQKSQNQAKTSGNLALKKLAGSEKISTRDLNREPLTYDELRAYSQAFYFGEGVPVDYAFAYKLYYECATRFNDKVSQFNLGVMNARGEGCVLSYENSFNWYKKASLNGHIRATFELGQCYYYGKGVEKDDGAFVAITKRAAQMGSYYAQMTLADLYENGYLVKKSVTEAMKYSRMASKNPNKDN